MVALVEKQEGTVQVVEEDLEDVEVLAIHGPQLHILTILIQMVIDKLDPILIITQILVVLMVQMVQVATQEMPILIVALMASVDLLNLW
jgi:hypothetical protein